MLAGGCDDAIACLSEVRLLRCVILSTKDVVPKSTADPKQPKIGMFK